MMEEIPDSHMTGGRNASPNYFDCPDSVRGNRPFPVFLLHPSIEMFDPLTVMIGSEIIHL